MAAPCVRGEWSSRCWGPGEPFGPPDGTSGTPTFSVATSSVGLPCPFPNLGEEPDLPGGTCYTGFFLLVYFVFDCVVLV